jgi:hypothetical protein
MKLDKSIAVFAMVASLMLAVGTAAAQDAPDAATVSDNVTLDEFNSSSSDTLDLDGGNVTEANLTSNQSTDQWAGLYGTATGTLALGEDSKTLYEWDAEAENVFAADAGLNVDWTAIGNGTAETVNASFGYLDGSTTPENTFNAGTNEQITFDGETFNGSTANTKDSNGDKQWSTVVLNDTSEGSSGAAVFAGIVDDSTNAFNGDPANYQLLLPAQDSATGETYNLYVELG